MSVSITSLAQELRHLTEWQQVPEELTDSDYHYMIVSAIKQLYIDTGRASVFNRDLLIDNGDIIYDAELGIDEERYILLVAQIGFYRKVASDVNRMVGYTTNALTVTNADKPYANIKATLDELQNERRIVYYKMSQYALLS